MVDYVPLRFRVGTITGGETRKVIGVSPANGLKPPPNGTLEVAKLQLAGEVITALEGAALTLRVMQLEDSVPVVRSTVVIDCGEAGPVDELGSRSGYQYSDEAPLYAEAELSAGAVEVQEVEGVLWCRINDA